MVVVALGAPMTPVVWISAQLDGANEVANVTEAVKPYLIRLFRFMVYLSCYFLWSPFSGFEQEVTEETEISISVSVISVCSC
jgi:hypothetical protein